MADESVLQFHSFYVNTERKTMTFDVVLLFDCDINTVLQALKDEVIFLYPD